VRIRTALLVAVMMVVCTRARAVCTVSLQAPGRVESGQGYEVLIVPTAETRNYVLTETFGARIFGSSLERSRIEAFPNTPSIRPFTHHSWVHRTTSDLSVTYRVVAVSPTDGRDACFAETTVTVAGDAELRRLASRGIIPIIGTVKGLNRSDFRTALKLTGDKSRNGRLVFHPAGRPGSDSDPSIRYEFTGTDPLIFEDIMAALGATGIGSLDVIPDENNTLLPEVETRIYNAADNGTYGTLQPMQMASEWLDLNVAQSGPVGLGVPARSPGLRLKVGIRSLTPVRVSSTVYRTDDTFEYGRTLNLDPDTLVMGSPEELFGVTVAAGDSLSVILSHGYGIPFYTLTDNVTNDPAIVIPRRTPALIERSSD
jgi:hypothetical protein